jgi:proteasome assembly chaperone (PAC2) family protein
VSTPAESPPHIEWIDPLPALRSPILITAFEGWNDAGDAATMAAAHVADRWDADAVAEIDAEMFYDFSMTRPLVQLDEAHQRSLTWPTNLFRAARVPGGAHDVIVLVGLEPQLRWRTFCEQVVGTAQVLGVSQVVTLGALLADVPHTRPVEVYGATDDEGLMTSLELAPSTYEGPTGIVGVLSAACLEAGIPTASFWAAVPSYVPGAPSPKAALSLVHRLCEVVGTSVYATDLEIASATYERQVDELVSEDEETAGYVTDLEEAWDASADEELSDDPDTLVAEVEKFLRENE